MRSTLKITCFTFILATVLVTSQITSCNVRQRNDKKKEISIDPVSEARTKELADKYDEGKGVFEIHCNTCHIAPDKHASDQQLFYNLFTKQSSDYVIKYISDSKQLKLSGDKYSNALDKVYKSDYEHFFKDSLSNLDFDNLIIYLKVATH